MVFLVKLCVFVTWWFAFQRSVQNARYRQRKFGDLGFELHAVVGGHLIAAAHRPDRRLELAAARVLKLFTGLEQGLLADNTETAHFLNARVGVGDDPVARDQLRRDGADVLDRDRVGEDVAVGRDVRLIADELRKRADGDLIFLACGHGEQSKLRELGIAHESAPRGKCDVVVLHMNVTSFVSQ